MLRILSITLAVMVLLANGCSKETEKAKSPESPLRPQKKTRFNWNSPPAQRTFPEAATKR